MLPRQVRHMTAQPGRLVRPLLTGTLLVVLGCGDEAPVEPPVPVATMVTVSPASSTTQALDDTVRLSATVLDQDGRVMATAVVEWSSGDTAVAVVDSAGLVTAVGSGAARVTAGSGGVAGEAVITVEQVVAEVRVVPDSVTFVAIGDTVRMVAESVDANGHGVVGADVEWSSSDETVAVVDSTGLVTVVANGTATTTAASGGVAGEAVVTVEQAVAEVRVVPDSVVFASIGDTARLAAEPVDANGHEVAGADVEWSSSDETVALVDSAGLVAAVANGTAAVTAAGYGVVGEVVVMVEQIVTEVRVTPDSVTLWAVGDTIRLGAEMVDGNGHAVADTERVWWSSNDDAVATVNRTGLVTAMRDGVTTIEAERGSMTGNAWVLVKSDYSERDALRAFYSATGGPSWINDDNWLTDAPLDDWHGIETNPQGRVIRIALNGNGLQGHIPRELGRLSELAVLDLGNLRNAWYFPCGDADFPDSNRLSGSIPRELGRLTNLEVLNLGSNILSGSIPPELGNLTKLRWLYLHNNDLSGPIPEELWYLSSLERLHLSFNRLTGPISSEIGRLTKLKWLALQCNDLSGPLPDAIGSLKAIEWLQLYETGLSGRLPSSVDQLRELYVLHLHGNQFSGNISPGLAADLADLPRLQVLQLSGNLLSGSIPRELGGSRSIRTLNLEGNQLTGMVPPEIGDLNRLRSLRLRDNPGLVGPFPLSLTRLTNVQYVYWRNTQLCVPRNQRFWSWAESMGYFRPRRTLGRMCEGLPTEVLEGFYKGTGGLGWAQNGNWLTESPLSSWYGITVEDGLVTALDLSGNELAGHLPSEIGEFMDVKNLDLSDNQLSGVLPTSIGDLARLETLYLKDNEFSGVVPHSLGRLGALKRLDLSDNDMEGALPGTFTDLGALEEFRWQGSGACAPEATWFQTWLSSLSTRDGPTCDAPFLLSIPGAHLTQATQDLAGTVPVIAGRPALLRVFATADRANDHGAGARAVLRSGSQPTVSLDMVLESARGIPDDLVLEDLARSYNAVIPASMLRPGVEMVVEVDPDGTVAWARGSQVRLPEVGHLGVDVRELPTAELTIVPIIAESNSDRSVLDWVESSGDAPIQFLRSILPIGDLSLEVREPFVVAQPPRAANGDDWERLLQDIDLLRTTEGESGYWYGVVQREGDVGIGGIAYIAGRSSLGVPDSEVFAHEVGHNMSLLHAPCGNPALLDSDFPYPDGSIGVPGYDFRSGELVAPSSPELMSYCGGAWRGGPMQWISDYNFTKAMEYRLTEEAARTATAAAAQQPPRGPRLLIRGGISPDGDLHLDPAFVLDAPVRTPTAPGPYRIEGLSTDGSTIFEHDFDMDEVSVGGGGFLFLLPFSEAAIGDLDRIVLTGPDGIVALDRGAPVDPVAIVLDRATGRIRSILRGEGAVEAVQAQAVGVRAGAAAVGATRTLISRGLPDIPR